MFHFHVWGIQPVITSDCVKSWNRFLFELDAKSPNIKSGDLAIIGTKIIVLTIYLYLSHKPVFANPALQALNVSFGKEILWVEATQIAQLRQHGRLSMIYNRVGVIKVTFQLLIH